MEIKNSATKNAKKLYKEKGIIKASAIRHEIILSWERTRIQEKALSLYNGGEYRTGEPKTEKKALDEMKTVMAKMKKYTSVILNYDGYVVLSNIADDNFCMPQSFIEGMAGTTAFSITRVTGKPFSVYYSEHYSDEFEEYVSYCIKLDKPGNNDKYNNAYIMVFDKKQINEKEIDFFIEEAAKEIKMRQSNNSKKSGEGLLTGIQRDVADEIIVNSVTGVKRDTKFEFNAKSDHYLVGTSNQILTLKNQLVHIGENHKFSRIYSHTRESALSCCHFIYESWLKRLSAETESVEDEENKIKNELHIINRCSEIEEFSGELNKDTKYFIVIDSLHNLHPKEQYSLANLMDKMFKRQIEVKITSIFYDGLSEEWINQTVIPSLHYLAVAPRLEYVDINGRKEDISVLAKYIIKKKISDDKGDRYTESFLEGIARQEWKNGISQIKNFIEFKMDRLPRDGKLDEYCIPLIKLKQSDDKPYRAAVVKKRDDEIKKDIASTDASLSKIEESEKKAIEQMLEECGRNISKTARQLEISRTTLYKKIKKYGL